MQLAVPGPTPPGMVPNIVLDSMPGKPLSVPMVAGTPRYLLFRNVYNEDLRPPKVIPNCSIMFQVCKYGIHSAACMLRLLNLLLTAVPEPLLFTTKTRSLALELVMPGQRAVHDVLISVYPACVPCQAEVYPAMDAFIPLLPENFLVTYSDVIPGLRRFDTHGQLSVTTKTVISTLASPMLSPTYSVVLRRLQLALPMKIHDLLMTMDTKQALPMA